MWALLIVAALACGVTRTNGATLTITPSHTLSGTTLSGTLLKMTLSTDDTYLDVNFTAPYFPGDSAVNRVHLFLANQNHSITEIEFTPASSAADLRLYWAPFNVLRTVAPNQGQASFTASTTTSSDKATWSGSAKLHRHFLPPRISLYNVAHVHPEHSGQASGQLRYDTLYAITNFGVALPDLMVLARYKAIGPRFLFDNDESYSKEWRSDS